MSSLEKLIDNKIEVALYYTETLTYFSLGIDIENMNDTLKYYEDLENYLACEGVSKAIEDYKQILTKHERNQTKIKR